MTLHLFQALTGRNPRSLDHQPLPWGYAVEDEDPLNNEGKQTIQSQTLSLTGSCKVWFLECLQGVILRDGMRHLRAARRHKDLVLKREKQADHIGTTAAAVLARAKDGNDETH
jgi:hypothetical protein